MKLHKRKGAATYDGPLDMLEALKPWIDGCDYEELKANPGLWRMSPGDSQWIGLCKALPDGPRNAMNALLSSRQLDRACQLWSKYCWPDPSVGQAYSAKHQSAYLPESWTEMTPDEWRLGKV